MGDNQSGGAHVNCVDIFLTVVSGQLRLMIKKFLIFKPECKFAFFFYRGKGFLGSERICGETLIQL